MSCSNCKKDNVMSMIMDRLAQLESKVEEMVLSNNAIVSGIANSIETKIDFLSNAENIINNQKAVMSECKVKAKLAFFKDEFKKDKNNWLNVLYTQDEIDELYNIDEIKKKSKEEHKLSKVAEYIYKKITKDSTKLAELNKFYEEYKEKQKENAKQSEMADEEEKENN